MPVEVKGIKQLRRDLKNFDPELLKEMNAQLKAAMMPIAEAARGFVPDIPANLSRWERAPRKAPRVHPLYRAFPKFNAEVIRKGIVYRAGTNKANKNGFQAMFYIANTSAAGAIYETAGRKSPYGQPWQGPVMGGGGSKSYSHSSNPDAGTHFVQSMPPLYGTDKQRGRLIYKAWEKDQAKATLGVIKAIDKTVNAFNKNRYRLAA